MVALATVDDVLVRLPDADAYLAETLLEVASERVRRYCRRQFTAGTRTDERQWSDGRVTLHEQPVTAVTEVRDGDGTAITGWELVGGTVHGLPVGNVQVDYDYGWTTVPADVVDVVANMVARRASAEIAPALQQEKIGDYFVGYQVSSQSALSGSMTLTESDRETLDAYRLRRVGAVHV